MKFNHDKYFFLGKKTCDPPDFVVLLTRLKTHETENFQSIKYFYSCQTRNYDCYYFKWIINHVIGKSLVSML